MIYIKGRQIDPKAFIVQLLLIPPTVLHTFYTKQNEILLPARVSCRFDIFCEMFFALICDNYTGIRVFTCLFLFFNPRTDVSRISLFWWGMRLPYSLLLALKVKNLMRIEFLLYKDFCKILESIQINKVFIKRYLTDFLEFFVFYLFIGISYLVR